MNRKLRKLLRNPRKFLLDSGLFGPRGPAPVAPAQPGTSVSQDSTPAPGPVPGASDDTSAQPHAPGAAQPGSEAGTETARAEGAASASAGAERAVEALDEPISGLPGYEAFSLHGRGWLEGNARPVMVLWGFQAWQRRHVLQYLPEYRLAFVDAATPWPQVQDNLDCIDAPRFMAWRHSECAEVRNYARRRGLPIVRMADGFIRSASRGSDQGMPYSVVLDEDGLSSGDEGPSGLERLLGRHDFSRSKALLAAVPSLLNLHRALGISKYNSASFFSPSHLLGAKLGRRILVLGNQEHAGQGGASSEAGWTAKNLVALAVAENPGAEVLFRPHPDNSKTYGKKSAAAAELASLCRVIPEEISIAELLHEVDRVYVDNSLAGWDALIHGVPVTVLGSPFYAGWGLTDDRQPMAWRPRQLALQELYCAVYLLHPKYLADLHDPLTGCLATIIRVAAERRMQLDHALTPKLAARQGARVARTDYWSALLKPVNMEQLTAAHGEKLLSVFSVGRAFADSKAQRFQRSVACFIVGQCQQVPLAALLKRMKASMRSDVYRQVLIDLWRMNPGPEVLEQLAWCAEQLDEFDEARRLLEQLAFGGEFAKDPDCRLPFAPAMHSAVLRLAELELDQKQVDRAEELFNGLLLSGSLVPEVFIGLATIARLRFDFASAALLLAIARRLHPTWRLGRAHLLHAQACGLTGDAASALESMAVACVTNPNFVGSVSTIHHVLGRQVGTLPYDQAMLLAVELGEPDNILGRARALIAHERHRDAQSLLLQHAPRRANETRHALALSTAYRYQGKLAQARELISRLLATSPTLPVYHEALSLAVGANDYAWGRELLAAAEGHHLEVKDAFKQKIALGLGQIKDCYLGYRKLKGAAALRSYLGGRYVQSLDLLSRQAGATNLVVAASGPGDEIRFTTFYEDIRAAGGDSRMVFTCDPRLLGLLGRHFTQFEFVPTARIRSLPRLEHFKDHDQLPGSDLHGLFDNRGWAAAQAADRVILVHDALGDVISDHACFKGQPSLKADPARVRQWRGRLSGQRGDDLLVGLSWRSSLTSFTRNENYLALEDLLPLFALQGVQFVNLQYDDCREELAWLEERLPGRLRHFEDLDQFNDLDGVAALMECLDLVIAPCTTVVELAGALGRPTLLLSNSSELHWRKIAGTCIDTWQNSIRHVEGPKLGDKKGLVQELAKEVHRHLAGFRPFVLTDPRQTHTRSEIELEDPN